MNPFDPGFFNENDLNKIGFKSLGENITIARNCTIIGPENIEIGDNVRIDGYSTIVAAGNATLKLGSYIHIGGYCFLAAGEGICLEDFCGLSQGVHIYTKTDDYSGNCLTNPTIPEEYTAVIKGAVILKRHVIVGSGSVVLPNVVIGEGSSIGALSLVNKSLDSWGMFAGSPVRRLKDRSKRMLELEAKLRMEQ